MNCQDFEKIIDDVAREQMMEATQRATGLAHAEGCERCAARLRDERTLSLGLRSLAASVRRQEAPEGVEATLLSAFRTLDRATPVTTGLEPAATPAAAVGARRPWRWATGIAAVLALLFAAFAAARLQPRQGLRPGQLASARDPQPLNIPSDFSAEAHPAVRPISGLATGGPGAVASPFTYQSAQARPRRGTERGGGNGAGISNRTAQPVNAPAYASAGDDIATDFIPLTYGAGLSGTDGGHVVRVELPRTALAQFGLPVNAERSAEPVMADVLLGEDGLARAIRFVR
jgi:hypothetical protein